MSDRRASAGFIGFGVLGQGSPRRLIITENCVHRAMKSKSSSSGKKGITAGTFPSTINMDATGSSTAQVPGAQALPPNVTIFCPAKGSTTQTLLSGRIFTRLTANARTKPSKLTALLKDAAYLKC
ncbi:hypothetical protein LZ30DRAFT_743059 [Colletotrichum cereale]|nr:hypothetical protein LZ30DRAFT_743059 [Colletotrichum cereale]